MDVEAWMPVQPGFGIRGLGGWRRCHKCRCSDVFFGVRRSIRRKKSHPFTVMVLWLALCDPLFLQGAERRKQGGGPMTLVVVSHGRVTAWLHRQSGWAAIQGLGLTLLVAAPTHVPEVPSRAAITPSESSLVAASTLNACSLHRTRTVRDRLQYSTTLRCASHQAQSVVPSSCFRRRK